MRKPTPGRMIHKKIGFFNITQHENQAEIKAYELWAKKKGFVYIGATTNKSGEFKIGRSRNLDQREKSLQIGNPYFSILYFMTSMDCHRAEKKLHMVFEDKKISGGWFRLSNEDMTRIISEYKFEVYKR